LSRVVVRGKKGGKIVTYSGEEQCFSVVPVKKRARKENKKGTSPDKKKSYKDVRRKKFCSGKQIP